MSNEIHTAISVTLFILLVLKVICDGWTKERSIQTNRPLRTKKLIDDCISAAAKQPTKTEEELYVLAFESGNTYLTARHMDTFNILGCIKIREKSFIPSIDHFTKDVLENSTLISIACATEEDVATAALNKL